MTLSKEQITAIAESIGLTYPIFAAFLQVESGGSGFDPRTGKIIIQYEPHVFCRYLEQFKVPYKLSITYENKKKKYRVDAKGLSLFNGVEGQEAEWKAFNTAFKMHQQSALLSTSLGLSQVLGMNYRKLGYNTVNEMWDSFKASEENQVKGMAQFIVNTPGLHTALLRNDWQTSAKLYNGAGYKVNKYDVKLEKAFNKFSANV
jgi:hypothetical protein